MPSSKYWNSCEMRLTASRYLPCVLFWNKDQANEKMQTTVSCLYTTKPAKWEYFNDVTQDSGWSRQLRRLLDSALCSQTFSLPG